MTHMVNDATLALIKKFEAFRACPYLPTPHDRWTRGYGRTAGITRSSKCITEPAAAEELRSNITANYAPAVDRALARYGFKANENQRGALVSLVYNLGPGILERGRSMGDALASRNRARIMAAFGVYVKQGPITLLGLVRRRAAEVALFRKPVKTPEQLQVEAWRARLKRVRTEAADRKRRGLDPWPKGLHDLADELKRNIRNHS